ncbi:MAG: hypothetical protein BWY21_00375 [Parcubacteria group bacterium ADurb.Bin216]|nr:MAG: hypothetical protein BWY21_00375 [Parcubacteria group bacterium ADurb.Bin216]
MPEDKDLVVQVTSDVVVKEQHALQVRQTEALTTLAEGVKAIAEFLSGGGLNAVLSGYARSQAVQSILGGLATNSGRNALDARVLGQNAIEIVEQVEAVFGKYKERLEEREQRDPELKDGESDFNKWLKEREDGSKE